MTRVSNQPQAPTQTVLWLLKRKGRAATKELAAALGVTGMAIRKHLSVLSAAGLVTYETERRPRGRPVRLYRLTEAGHDVFPKDYERLALVVLDKIAQTEGQDRVEAMVSAYQEGLRQQAAERLKGLDLEQRVAEMTSLLDERGHLAEWQPHPEGYLIIEHNCPISRVSRRFPECCRGELALLSEMLGTSVQRLSDQAGGDPECRYLVRKSEG